jgi:hypothetical protein
MYKAILAAPSTGLLKQYIKNRNQNKTSGKLDPDPNQCKKPKTESVLRQKTRNNGSLTLQGFTLCCKTIPPYPESGLGFLKFLKFGLKGGQGRSMFHF